MEAGDIYVLYRPRAGMDVRGIATIQASYIVLHPRDREIYRLLVVMRPTLPDPRNVGEARWAFVAKVTRRPEDIENEFDMVVFGPAADDMLRPARAAAEGVYRIVAHSDHTHLAYATELPERPGEVQAALGIAREGSYIVALANPSEAMAEGLGSDRPRPRFPSQLEDRFGERRFIPLDPLFLDYE